MDSKANRNYKDSVFIKYLSNPKRLVEVYNAISGASYPMDTLVKICTLRDILYMNRINDVAFLMGDVLVVLIGHQSTINYNVPLRFLMYAAREYEKILDLNGIYNRKLIKIPTMEFYVLYIGDSKYKDQEILRLSDAFKSKPAENSLELVVKVINIGYGHSKEILEKSKSISDYSMFVYQVETGVKQGLTREEAIKRAVDYCIDHDVMREFLEENASEVRNMLFEEWNMDDALKVARKEGREEGREEGIDIGVKKGREEGINIGVEKGRCDMIKTMLESLPIEEVSNILKMSVSEIKRTLQLA